MNTSTLNTTKKTNSIPMVDDDTMLDETCNVTVIKNDTLTDLDSSKNRSLNQSDSISNLTATSDGDATIVAVKSVKEHAKKLNRLNTESELRVAELQSRANKTPTHSAQQPELPYKVKHNLADPKPIILMLFIVKLRFKPAPKNIEIEAFDVTDVSFV